MTLKVTLADEVFLSPYDGKYSTHYLRLFTYDSAYMACNFKCHVETEGAVKIIRNHVHCKIGIGGDVTGCLKSVNKNTTKSKLIVLSVRNFELLLSLFVL